MLPCPVFCRLQLFVFGLLLWLLPATAQSQQVRLINEHGLQSLLADKSDTLRIVNFWATWCKPCVKELPYFMQIADETKASNVKVILVSVDFKEDTESRLIPFLKKQKMTEPMLLMNPENDQWMNVVNEQWSGAIPATVIYNHQRGIYFFAERELTPDELRKYVLLNQKARP